jgi:hypothetical protein
MTAGPQRISGGFDANGFLKGAIANRSIYGGWQ